VGVLVHIDEGQSSESWDGKKEKEEEKE